MNNLTVDQLKELLQIQKEFDDRIPTLNLRDSKIAYVVEFFEWFNTLETFKNWKKKPVSNGAVYTDDEDVRLIHDKKLDKLEEIIEESQGQPILLFYNFKHDKERILQRFKEATTLEDSNYKERWNSGDIKLLIAHPASAGHGLNLQQGGHIIVWFGLTWSLELYQQANARLYRQGQNHTTIIHHIITDNTIDQRVYKALQNKELTQEELMKAIKARIAKHK
ncbi:TPA: hypothetical protein OZE33_000437 [Staphylococcus aureus]|nr:hypothetical protein [Staphylococcus aureus]